MGKSKNPLPVRDDFRPADLLFFAGRGFESRFIALATCSLEQLVRREWFSHVGIVSVYRGRTLLFESTTLNPEPCAIQCRKVNGPQAHEPTARVRAYHGKVWRLRIEPRKALLPSETDRLTDFLYSKLGDGYDYAGAAISGTRLLRLARWCRPNLDNLFCSYYSMAALQDIGRLASDLSAASYSPARAARDLQYWALYQPIGIHGSESIRLK